jgi:hypothetical protein
MLRERDLGQAPMFVISEMRLDDQRLLPDRILLPLREWLESLARSSAARAAVVRQTVDGAIVALGPSIARLAAAAEEQVDTLDSLGAVVERAYRTAEIAVDHGVRDGVLFRGEVLARWQELVGTGELMRSLQARIGWLRDRIVDAVTGRQRSTERLQVALESGLVTLVYGAAADAAEQAASAWRAHPAGAALLAHQRNGSARSDAPAPRSDLAVPAADLQQRLERLVRDWQRGVLELVRTEAGDKRFVAKAGAYAINTLGLVVMIGVFTATAFIPTGAEIAVAGGTTLAAQKVLEAIFGDQAVRELADKARRDLLERVHALLEEEANRFDTVLTDAGVDRTASHRLRAAAAAVHAARLADPLPTGAPRTGGAPWA